jgi:hypothetical protein
MMKSPCRIRPGGPNVPSQSAPEVYAGYHAVVRLEPTSARGYNGRAWLWATCPEAKYRDGKRAVESATTACELSAWKEPNDVDTLSAAQAEAGDFDAAVKSQSKAISLLTDPAKKQDYRSRLMLYEQHKPYRTPLP